MTHKLLLGQVGRYPLRLDVAKGQLYGVWQHPEYHFLGLPVAVEQKFSQSL